MTVQGLVETQTVHPDNGGEKSRRTTKGQGRPGGHSAGEMTAGKSTLVRALDFAKLCKHQSNNKVNTMPVIVRNLEEGEGIDRWKPEVSRGQKPPLCPRQDKAHYSKFIQQATFTGALMKTVGFSQHESMLVPYCQCGHPCLEQRKMSVTSSSWNERCCIRDCFL